MTVHIARPFKVQRKSTVLLLHKTVQIFLHIIIIDCPPVRLRLINVIKPFHHHAVIIAVIIQEPFVAQRGALLVIPCKKKILCGKHLFGNIDPGLYGQVINVAACLFHCGFDLFCFHFVTSLYVNLFISCFPLCFREKAYSLSMSP